MAQLGQKLMIMLEEAMLYNLETNRVKHGRAKQEVPTSGRVGWFVHKMLFL